MPKGLLIDLDGTVLPQNNRPTQRVIDAISAASEVMPVALASGRAQDEVCHFARLFGLTTPQIADNGATLLDPLTGRALQRTTLNRHDAEAAIEALEAVTNRLIICDSGRFIEDKDEIVDWSITVVAARIASESEAMEWVERLTTDTVSASTSIDNQRHWYIDCTAAGVDKSHGAREFAKTFGIDVADLMVIGDGWNDIPMFEIAETAIAMDGAPQALLELANAVVPNIDHDGAAVAIEKYVLGR